MFVVTRPKAAPPDVRLVRIPQADIFRNSPRTKLVETERNNYTQTQERFWVRATDNVGSVPSYDADMMDGLSRAPVSLLVCPVNMTGYTQDNWVVSASSEKYGDTLAWMAFNPEDGWRTSEWGCNSSIPCWLQWTNTSRAVRVREYVIQGSASYGGPLAWRLEGKNSEDEVWSILDSRTESSWPNKTTRTYQIPDNKARFTSHRLYFTRATDGDNPIACVWAYSEVREDS